MTLIADRRSTLRRTQARASRTTRLEKKEPRTIEAGFDLTRTSNENKRHWGDADALSGRAAYFKGERKTARERSRLEAANNSWYAGMLRTAANHIIGTGPRLQVLTDNPDFNRRVERAWKRWARIIGLNAKLRTAVETYWRDGEVFFMRANRPALKPISLDIRMYEADQVAQPYWHILDPTIEDGKRIDNLGNAVEYWIYDHHPGDLNIGHLNILTGDWYRADDVCHLFRADRPGQLRGFPRCAPALDWLAHLRRYSKATLSAAEKAALWGVFIKTNGSAMTATRMPADFMTVEWERDMMNFLPEGWAPEQLKSEHPANTNESFQRSELTYFARCSNMPYSLAAGTSRDSNFASAKMDIKNLWEPEVKSERSLIESTCLASFVRWFLEDAIFADGIMDDAPPLDQIDYEFFWPPLPVSDEADAADARQTRLESGMSTFSIEANEQGLDDEQLCEAAARDNNVTVQEFKKARFNQTFGIDPNAAAPMPAAAPAAQSPAPMRRPLPTPKKSKLAAAARKAQRIRQRAGITQ